MVWSHNDNWMVTGDHQGNVKYWQSNMNNVRAFQAHKDPVRGIRYNHITLFLKSNVYLKRTTDTPESTNIHFALGRNYG